MSDIGTRIHRNRLSRYALPVDRVRRRLRWVWALGALWLIWISLVGDHSLWRIWRLSEENRRAAQRLAQTNAEIAKQDQWLHDPRTERERAERDLRDKGMARKGELVYRIRGAEPARAP